MAMSSRAARSREELARGVVFARRYDNGYILRRTVTSIWNHVWAYFWNELQLGCYDDRGVELQRRSEWPPIAAHTPVSARTTNSESVFFNTICKQFAHSPTDGHVKQSQHWSKPNQTTCGVSWILSICTYAMRCASRDDSA